MSVYGALILMLTFGIFLLSLFTYISWKKNNRPYPNGKRLLATQCNCKPTAFKAACASGVLVALPFLLYSYYTIYIQKLQ